MSGKINTQYCNYSTTELDTIFLHLLVDLLHIYLVFTCGKPDVNSATLLFIKDTTKFILSGLTCHTIIRRRYNILELYLL